MKTMKTFSRRIAALLLVVTVGITALAPAASAANIQLPSLPKDQCVVDDAGVLSDSTTSELETLNAQLSSSCDGAQIGVLTVDYTGSATTEDYATEAFNTWGIGSSSKNNGVLILLVMQSDQYADGDYYLTYGDGFRSTMLADQASTLVQTMEDDFAAKKYDSAVLTCATNVANTIAEVYGVTLSGGTIYSDGSDTQTTRPSVEPLGKHYRRHFLHACLYHPVHRSFLYLYHPSRPLLRLVLGAVWLVRRTASAQRPAPSPRPLR